MPAALAFQARAAGMRRWSQALFVFVALTAFAVVQLGEHYVVDAVAGIAFAWLVVRLVSRFAPIAAAVDAPEVESLEAAEQPRAA
jgi:membrane-associated phospholipid phosphatase